MATPVYLEVGEKKVFACSLEWPGWARGARTEDEALEALAAYADRYRPVAEEAGVRFPKSAGTSLDVVERVKGNATTDFGALGVWPEADRDVDMTAATARRLAGLAEASWTVLARAAARAPATLAKGPRGGGRDRDQIVAHVADAERAYASRIGLSFRQPTSDEIHAGLLDALRSARTAIPDVERNPWPYRYAARRIAWHALDHAWEIEDKS